MIITFQIKMFILASEAGTDNMSEWLRSLTRNQMGFARVGSNPAVVGFFSNDYHSSVVQKYL